MGKGKRLVKRRRSVEASRPQVDREIEGLRTNIRALFGLNPAQLGIVGGYGVSRVKSSSLIVVRVGVSAEKFETFRKRYEHRLRSIAPRARFDIYSVG